MMVNLRLDSLMQHARVIIKAFLRREVLSHAQHAWYVPDSVKTGYEISFTSYFYKPRPLRTLEEICTDILALEKGTEGLLSEIIRGRHDG